MSTGGIETEVSGATSWVERNETLKKTSSDDNEKQEENCSFLDHFFQNDYHRSKKSKEIEV